MRNGFLAHEFASLAIEGREDSSPELAEKNSGHLLLFLEAVCVITIQRPIPVLWKGVYVYRD